MRVFVTGATGFIGSAIVKDLIGAGHKVLGLSRSDAGAESLAIAGAEAHRGDLTDLESLKRGAADSDGVIHTAFVHDFSRFQEVCEIDRRAIEALGSALTGSSRPLVITPALAWARPRPVSLRLKIISISTTRIPRISSELAGASVAERGVRVSVMRLPQVHNRVKQGLISYLIAVARDKGVSAYVDEGLNRWPAVHVLDAAPLYRLALEKNIAGAR